MSLEIVVGLLGSGLVRAVASEVATTLACQAISAAVGSMARPVVAGLTDSVGAGLTESQDQGAVPAAQPAELPVVARPAAYTAPAPALAPEDFALHTVSTVEVLSSIPGRARLRVRGVRDDAARAAEVTNQVRALDGVTHVEANTLTGALLVRFDARQTDVQTIVAALEPPVRTRPLRAAERAPYLRLVVG